MKHNKSLLQQVQKHLISALKVGVAAGLIYWLIQSGHLDFNQLLHLFQPGYLVVLYLMMVLNIALNNLRWYLLLIGQKFNVTFWSTFKLTFIGLFFNFAVPGGVGGDLAKGYYVVQDHPARRMAAAASILLDRLIGFFSMLCLSLFALFMNFHLIKIRPELASLSLATTGLFLAFIVLFATSFSNRLKNFSARIFERLPAGGKFQQLHETFYAYRKEPKVLFYALALSIVSQVFMIFFYMVVGNAMGEVIPWECYFFVVPIGAIIMAAPVAPAGIGVGQAAFLFLFNLYLGEKHLVGPTAVTANQIVMLSLGLLGAIPYFQRKKPKFEELPVGEMTS